MMRRLLVGCLVALMISTCFAGYSGGGGRSGFSSGGRSFSSVRSGGYSSGRSGYARAAPSRAYVAPRSYASTSRTTVIHNNHYSHGGFGFGGGGGFFNGFLGGYLGGTMASAHNPVIMAGGGQMIPQGQGMLVDGYVDPSYGIYRAVMNIIGILFLTIILIAFGVVVYRALFDTRYRSY